MSTHRAVSLLCLSLLGLSSCAAGGTAPRSSPLAGAAADVPLPDFNSRLGSNRVAAEAATRLGRKLFAGGQYWEVYVRTQPATLPGHYDPADPAASAPMAALVTSTEVVLATESGGAIKAFSAGGDAHERSVLLELDAILRQAFPNLVGDSMRIFYGESFQHGTATFDHGRLVSYDVRKIG
jgi:hypothetical protein